MTHDEIMTLDGVELRKACLIAAGWKVQVSPGGSRWQMIDPNGYISFEVEQKPNQTEDYAWQYAPAIESSVDLALQYLTLAPTYFWRIVSGLDGYSNSWWHIKVRTSGGKEEYVADGKLLPVVICRAWLIYKSVTTT